MRINYNFFFFIFSLLLIPVLTAQHSTNFSDHIAPSNISVADEAITNFHPSHENLFFWDEVIQDWFSEENFSYQYDDSNKLSLKTIKNSEGENLSQTVYEYNNLDFLIFETVLNYDPNSETFLPSYRKVFQYSNNGTLIYEAYAVYNEQEWQTQWSETTNITLDENNLWPILIEKFDSVDTNQILATKTANDYDLDFRLLSRIVEVDSGSGYKNYEKYELTYDNNFSLQSYIKFTVNEDYEWIEKFRYVDLEFEAYNSFDDFRTRKITTQEWINNIWVNKTKSETTFNGSDSEEIISLNFSGFWIVDYKNIFNYDSQGMPLLFQSEFQFEGTWRIDESFEFINTYSGDMNQVFKIVLKQWDDKFQSNQNFSQRIFDYPLSVNKIKSGIAIHIFPNPVSHSINIVMPFSSAFTDMQCNLMDMQGKTIFSKTLKNANELIDIQHLSTGTYLMVIQSKGNIIKTEKLIIHNR